MTNTTTTTIATTLEMENKKSMEEKACDMNAKIEKVCGYLRRTIDIKDARDYVKQVNELIKSYKIKTDRNKKKFIEFFTKDVVQLEKLE